MGVHLGSVLSSLLFIIVLESISREFRVTVGHPWKLLYADDLNLIADTEDALMIKLSVWTWAPAGIRTYASAYARNKKNWKF